MVTKEFAVVKDCCLEDSWRSHKSTFYCYASVLMCFNAPFALSLSLTAAEGQERFGNMTRVYYREAMGAFIVFDVTRPTTFEAVIKWKEDLDSKLTLANGKSIATVLLANKCDQSRDSVSNNGLKLDQFCQENGFVGWFETSAKVRCVIDTVCMYPSVY